MKGTQPLIPTPVVDKNGRLTTVHKRGPQNTNGINIPQPRSQPPYTVTEVDLGEFGNLISPDCHRDAWEKIPLVDQDILAKVLVLAKSDQRWWTTISRVLNLILIARRKPPYIEARMRHILAVAPIADETKLLDKLKIIDTAINFAFIMQNKFHVVSGVGAVEEWGAGSDIKARGCMLAISACTAKIMANDPGKGILTEEDALWLGTHSEALIQIMPQLVEREICTRADVGPLLESPAPAVREGFL